MFVVVFVCEPECLCFLSYGVDCIIMFVIIFMFLYVAECIIEGVDIVVSAGCSLYECKRIKWGECVCVCLCL